MPPKPQQDSPRSYCIYMIVFKYTLYVSGVGTTECGQLYPVVQTGCKKRKTNLSDDVLVKQEPGKCKQP